MRTWSLLDIRNEADVSRRLWVKVLGMLEQNWCLLEAASDGGYDMVFFDDHGDVFDWLPATDLPSAQGALVANGYRWTWTSSSCFKFAGMPQLPAQGIRQRTRPVYSSGEYWTEPSGYERLPASSSRIPMRASRDDLSRFVDAQDLVWYSVVEELASGSKQTHWMWFVFPQLRGLGASQMADYFGLSSPSEAARYWDDRVLGDRLRICLEILMGVLGARSPEQIFGKIDAMKLRSCMTIFENVAYDNDGIAELLDRHFAGERCRRSAQMISEAAPARRMRFSR